jgi:hypothetical protein
MSLVEMGSLIEVIVKGRVDEAELLDTLRA